jgi:MFS family permease
VHADRAVRFILAAVFAVDVLTALIVIGYGNSYLLKTLDAPASYPAFALGVYGFVKLATAPVSGRLIDRALPAVSVALAGGLQAGGVGVMLVVGTAEGFIAGAGVLSAGTTLMWLLIFRALADALPLEGRGIATAYLGLTSAVSIALGFAAAALLAESESSVVFLTGVVLAMGSAALLWPVFAGGVRPRRARPAPEANTEAAHDRRAESFAGAVVLAHFLAVNATVVAFSPFALDLLDLTLLQLGLLLAPAAAAAGLAMLLAGRRSRHGHRLREAVPLYVVGAAALFLTALTSHWGWFALGMIAAGVAMGGTTPLLNSARIDLSVVTGAPGQVLGRLLFDEGLGSVLGPIVIGLVIVAAGIRAGAVAAGFAFVALALLAGTAARSVRV